MGERPSVRNQTRGALCAGHCGVLGGRAEEGKSAGVGFVIWGCEGGALFLCGVRWGWRGKCDRERWG